MWKRGINKISQYFTSILYTSKNLFLNRSTSNPANERGSPPLSMLLAVSGRDVVSSEVLVLSSTIVSSLLGGLEILSLADSEN